MKKRFFIVLFLSASLFAGAQEQELSLQDCRDLALKNNSDIRIAQKNIAKMEATKKSARAMYFPKIAASGTYGYMFNNIELLPAGLKLPVSGEPMPNITFNPSTGLPVIDPSKPFDLFGILPLELSLKNAFIIEASLEQPIFAGGRIVAGNRLARIGMEVADLNMELQRSNTVLEADKSYWLYVSVNEKVKLAETYMQLLDALEKKVKDGYEVGMATRNDLLKVQVEKGEAELSLQKARNGLSLARMSLCRQLGLDFSTAIIATDTVIDIDSDFTAALAENCGSVEKRPEYAMLQKQIEAKKQETRMTRGDYLPTAGVRVGYSYYGGVRVPSMGYNYSGHGPTIIANLSIPIFHFGEGANKVKASKIDMEISPIELEKNSELMMLQIEQARVNLLDAYTQVGIAERSLANAEDNIRMAKDGFETGMADITTLLMAQTQWQSIYSNLIDSKTNYMIMKSSYLNAVGELY